MSTKLFFSYARGDDEAFVRRLRDDLTRVGFEIWFDRLDMPSRQLTFLDEIGRTIAACDRLVLVVGPKMGSSSYVEKEWRHALEVDRCVNPIVRLDGCNPDGTLRDGYDLIPDELSLLKVHAEDFRDDTHYSEHLANLIRQLSEPLPTVGKVVGVPSLPWHYRSQPERLKALREELLVDLHQPLVISGAAAHVGIQGMGGIGKTVLAMALARDLQIRRSFPDGIFWVTLGQQPNVPEKQRSLVNELGGDAMFLDIPAGRERLRESLKQRQALLILDDVWQRPDLDAFDTLGPRCKLLFTTRQGGLLSSLGATEFQMQLPTESEALALLATATDTTPESLPAEAREVIVECGRLPLALALCGGMLRAGTPFTHLLEALRAHELEFLQDSHAAEPQHQNIWRTMEISLRALPDQHRRHFAELAVFPNDAFIPEAAVLTLWRHTGRMSERHAHQLLIEFKQRSLLRLERARHDQDAFRVLMHDLLHDFAIRLATSPDRDLDASASSLAHLHQQLLDAYQKQCPTGWSSGPKDGYFFPKLGHHLLAANRQNDFVTLVLDHSWLEAKHQDGLTFDLPADFSQARRVVSANDPQSELLAIIEKALRRDIHFIARHREDYPQGLFQSLWNSCWWYDSPSAGEHYINADGPWNSKGKKISDWMEAWWKKRVSESQLLPWMKSLRPPAMALTGDEAAVMRGHENPVTSATLSQDGLIVASGSWDGRVRLWEVSTGRHIANLNEPHEGLPWAIEAVLPAFANGLLGGHGDRLNGPRLIPAGSSVSFSPDGRLLASGSDDKVVRIWDVSSGCELATLWGHEAAITCVSFSPDGRYLATGSDDMTVRLWEVASRQELAVLRGHCRGVSSVSFSFDGRLLASGSDDATVRLWEAASTQELATLSGHSLIVSAVCFSPDATQLVSGSWDKTARVWEVKSGKPIQVLSGHEGEINAVSFNPKGEFVATASDDKTVRVWRAASGEQIMVLRGHTHAVSSLSFSPDGTQLVSGSWDKTLRLWTMNDGLRQPLQLRGHEEEIAVVSFNPNGEFLVSGSHDGTMRLWLASSGRELAVGRAHEHWVVGVRFLDEKLLATTSYDWTVRVWEFPAALQVAVLRGKFWFTRVDFSLNGRMLANATDDGTVEIWNLRTGEKIASLKGHEHAAKKAVFSPDGNLLASGAEDRTVRLWEVSTGRQLAVLRGHEDGIWSLAFSPDGSTLASGSQDKTVRLWEIASHKEMAVLRGHRGTVYELAFSRDGLCLASSSDDQKVLLWNVANGRNRGVVLGRGDLKAIAAGPSVFPWRGLVRGGELVIEDASTGSPVAFFPLSWDRDSGAKLATHPCGHVWAAADDSYLALVHLHMPIEAVLHPASAVAKQTATEQRVAAEAAGPMPEQELAAERWLEQGLAATDLDTKFLCFTEAVRLKPDFAWAYYWRGSARRDKNDLDGALADLTEAIRLQPDLSVAYGNRGGILSRKRDLGGALADFTEAIRLQPDAVKAYNNRGFVRSECGDYDGAMEDFNQALRLQPDSYAYTNRGDLRRRNGDLDGALADFTEAIRLEPNEAEFYNHRGLARSDKGELDGALEDFAQAIRLKPGFAAGHYNRALIREQQRDYSAAVTEYQMYLDVGGGVHHKNQGAVERRIRELRREL